MVQTFWHNTTLNEEFFGTAYIKLIVANFSLTLAFLPLKLDPLSIAGKDSYVDKALWLFRKTN